MDYPIEINQANLYQGKVLILKNIDLKVSSGEFVFLVGRTGSGKSTVLKSLYGALPILEGSAKISNYELNGIKDRKVPFLRRELGIVFQDFQLLQDRSAEENLLFVMKATGWKSKRQMIDRAHEVLQKVGLENKGYKFPAELSGGATTFSNCEGIVEFAKACTCR